MSILGMIGLLIDRTSKKPCTYKDCSGMMTLKRVRVQSPTSPTTPSRLWEKVGICDLNPRHQHSFDAVVD